MSSELIYANKIPQYAINTETFGNGNGDLLKIGVYDLRMGTNEELLVQRRYNKEYVQIQDINSQILNSEERFSLFKTTYGIFEANIDFSTFKFRKLAGVDSDKILLCRVIAPIKIQRIKQSVIDRTDFGEYIQDFHDEIYDPPSQIYSVISLYGVSDQENDIDSQVDTENQEMKKVFIEI